MRNFDDTRKTGRPIDERQFVLRGHTFTVRPHVSPEAQAILEDTLMQPSATQVLADYDRAFKLYLVDEDGDHWDRVRQIKGAEVVTMDDIEAVMRFMVEVTTERPTKAPSDSSDGRDGTRDSSGAASSQQEATRAA